MKSKFHVYLRIIDSKFSSLPEKVTMTTGIQPTEIWHKDDLRGKTLIKEKEHGWELKSKLPKEKPLRDHVEYLLSAIESSLESFKMITVQYYTELSCSSKELDDTGLFYFGARYYEPGMGRFITPDPVDVPGRNLYVYCYNNPLGYIDPDGRNPLAIILAIYAGVSTAINIADAYQYGGARAAFEVGLISFVTWGLTSGIDFGDGFGASIAEGAVRGGISGGFMSVAGGGDVAKGMWQGATWGAGFAAIGWLAETYYSSYYQDKGYSEYVSDYMYHNSTAEASNGPALLDSGGGGNFGRDRLLSYAEWKAFKRIQQEKVVLELMNKYPMENYLIIGGEGAKSVKVGQRGYDWFKHSGISQQNAMNIKKDSS